jgi:hypothetical protein
VSGRDEVESFSDRFLDVMLDKGLLWLLVGTGVLAVVVAVVQVGRWVA